MKQPCIVNLRNHITIVVTKLSNKLCLEEINLLEDKN